MSEMKPLCFSTVSYVTYFLSLHTCNACFSYVEAILIFFYFTFTLNRAKTTAFDIYGRLKTNFHRNENLLSKFKIGNGHPIGIYLS